MYNKSEECFVQYVCFFDREASTYPEENVLLRWINRFSTSYDLQKKNAKCKHVSFLINNTMHEVLWSQVSKCTLYWNNSMVCPFARKPFRKPKIRNLHMDFSKSILMHTWQIQAYQKS